MNNPFDLDESNRGVLMLSQAMLGAISSNFRMVTLTRNNASWKIQFFLETDNSDDQEEIQEIIEEFESLQETGIKYEVDIIVSGDEIKWPELPTRAIYRRREIL